MTGYHDKNSKVTGLWTIIECVSLSGSSESAGIEGTEFILTENGDVEWHIKGDHKNLPLFECHMFEVYTYQNLQCYVKRTLLRFATYKGHVIEFRLDQPVMSEDLMLLTYDGWFMLQCEKAPIPTPKPQRPFSMLPALEDEYFVDFSISSKSGKKFLCHSIVLQSMMPSYDWATIQEGHTVLCRLDDVVIGVLMHYLYSYSLPRDLSFTNAKLCILSTESIRDLQDFKEMCYVYARNICFRNKIIGLVNEVHEHLKAVSQIIFSAQEFIARPSDVIRKLKEGLTPFAISIVKVFEMCYEFEVMCNVLNDQEQKSIIRYIRSHVPVVLDEIKDIIKCVMGILNSLSVHSRLEFAQELVPEIQFALHLIVFDVAALRNCLEQIIQASSLSADSPTKGPSLVKSLENDLHLRELQKLRILQENLTSMANSLLNKKIQFEEVESNSRNRGVARMLELLALELPELILRLIDFATAMDDIFDWSEFKFVFKGGTSKLHRILDKLARHSNIVEILIQDIVETVNNSIFTNAISNLGFFTSKCDSTNNTAAKLSQMSLSKEILVTQNPSECGQNDPEQVATFFHHVVESKDEYEGFSEIPLNDNLACHDNLSTTNNEGSNIEATHLQSNSKNYSNSLMAKHLIHLEDLKNYAELPSSLNDEANKLDLVNQVCEIPSALKSKLAKALFIMMNDQKMVDLTFCIIPPKEDDECSNSSGDNSSNENSVNYSTSFHFKTNSSPVASHSCDPFYKYLPKLNQPNGENLKKSEDNMKGITTLINLQDGQLNALDDVYDEDFMQTFSDSRIKAIKLKKSLSFDTTSIIHHDSHLPLAFNSSDTAAMEGRKCHNFKQSFSLDMTDKTHKETQVFCKEIAKKNTPETLFPCDSEGQKESCKGVEIKAHRVVIATQCEWFKRALLSGMKEAIDSYIEVPGCSVHIFKIFLDHLYNGLFEAESLATDELVDFLVLVDHYGVDFLKTLVEEHLEKRVDDETVIPLLMISYHCNITKLKDLCLHHCALKKRYELIHQLPTDLRQQLINVILSLKKWNQLDDGRFETSAFGLLPDDSSDLRERSEERDLFSVVEPLIDEELSSLLCNTQDSACSSEEGFDGSPSNDNDR